MPNEVSDAFHADLDAIKAEVETILSDIEGAFNAIVSDLSTVFQTLLQNAEPLLVATASAAVNAVLTGATGGLSGIAAAAEAAAVSTITAGGTTLADEALAQLKTLVLGNVLKTTANPTQGAGPTTSG